MWRKKEREHAGSRAIRILSRPCSSTCSLVFIGTFSFFSRLTCFVVTFLKVKTKLQAHFDLVQFVPYKASARIDNIHTYT
jgi:hypothetical protein